MGYVTNMKNFFKAKGKAEELEAAGGQKVFLSKEQ